MATPIKIGGKEGVAGKGVIFCRAATTAALATNTLSSNKLVATANGALAKQDEVSLAVGDYLLVKNEAEGKKNGPYKVLSLGSAGSKYELERVPEMDTSEEARPGMALRVAEGTQNGGVTFALLTTGAITLNTTSLSFGYAGAWVAPTFENAWENFEAAGTYDAVFYRKGLDGRVYLKGLVKKASGATNAIIFTLPAGFRPSKALLFVCRGSSGGENSYRVDVGSGGNVNPVGNPASMEWLSLNGISFYPD